jgi:hypothetical protein
VALSESAENEAVKLAANREILDRLLGKAMQPVETKQYVTLDIKAVDQELKALEEQERELFKRGREAHSGGLVTPTNDTLEEPAPSPGPLGDELYKKYPVNPLAN